MISLIICSVRELSLGTQNITLCVQTCNEGNISVVKFTLKLRRETLYLYLAWTRNDICALFVSCEDVWIYSRVEIEFVTSVRYQCSQCNDFN